MHICPSLLSLTVQCTSSSPHHLWRSWSDWKPAQQKKEMAHPQTHYFPRQTQLLFAPSPSAREKRGTEQHGWQWVAPPRQRTGPQQPRLNFTSAAVLKLSWKFSRIVTGPNKSIKGRNLAQKPISQKGLLGKKFGCYFCGLQVLTENYISFFGLCKSTLKIYLWCLRSSDM